MIITQNKWIEMPRVYPQLPHRYVPIFFRLPFDLVGVYEGIYTRIAGVGLLTAIQFMAVN